MLASQLTRMLAFTNKDLIADDDVVMTVDVNAFVMTDKILDPILDNQDRKVWVYQVSSLAQDNYRVRVKNVSPVWNYK